ncbi:unannotated protein [freshwater metagenome]|uniref:Unannotated protein n=1 Tax=freshwater metagenome TaxID=449393 RepID=A0A6J6HHR2_9ZZZZ
MHTFTKSVRPRLALTSVTLNTALAAASAIIALAFGLSTLDRWLRRRRPHELAWTIAMGLFVVAALSLWWAEGHGWSTVSFRMFFTFGAIVNVPWLALGTVFLLAGPRAGQITTRVLLVFSGFATGVAFVAPIHGTIDPHTLPTGSEHFDALPRILAAVGSSIPALVIFVGAAWSAWRVLRGANPALTSAASRQVRSTRLLALGNILIAAGATILSASGTFSGRLGADRAFAVTLFVGITVLFAGFLVASNATHGSSAVRSAAPSR